MFKEKFLKLCRSGAATVILIILGSVIFGLSMIASIIFSTDLLCAILLLISCIILSFVIFAKDELSALDDKIIKENTLGTLILSIQSFCKRILFWPLFIIGWCILDSYGIKSIIIYAIFAFILAFICVVASVIISSYFKTKIKEPASGFIIM